MNKLEHFILPENTNSLYKNEAISSISLTKNVASKINELVDAYNLLSQEDLKWKQTQEGIIRKGVIYMKDNLLNSLNDLMVLLRDSGFIDDRIEFHCNDLKSRLDSLLGSITEGSTALDSELLDLRVGADGNTYQNAGTSIRYQFLKAVRCDGTKSKLDFKTLNDCLTNTICSITDWTNISDLPINEVGTCLTLSSDINNKRGVQFYATYSNKLFYRIFWTSNNEKYWKDWVNTDFTENIVSCVKAKGWITKDEVSDINNLEANTIYSVTDWTNMQNLPINKVGTCITLSSDNECKRGIQFYATNEGNLYHRVFWTPSTNIRYWGEWKNYKANITFPKILIYPKQYAVVGRELNLYFCQMFDCLDWKAEGITPMISYNGTGLKCYDDRISIIPTKAGTHTLNIAISKIIDGASVTSSQLSITVDVSENKKPASKNVLFIGDSRTDFARLCSYPKSEIENIVFLGTLSEGDLNHEGRSGWTAKGYCTLSERNSVTNPFFNPNTNKFDFSYYMESQNYTSVDYINLMFGVNSIYSSDAPAYIEQMIASIHEYDPSIKISVMTEYVLPFASYYAGDFKRTMLGQLFYQLLVDKLGGRENENIFILSTNLAIDHKFDWTYKDVQICQLNSETTSVIADNIHPKSCGYNKLANVWLMFYQNMEL